MKVVVVGAGAVGGYFGGRLQEAGVDVTFLVRERREAQLREGGMSIVSTHGAHRFEPQLVTSVEQVESCDLLVLAVKNYHLRDAIEPLRPLVARGAKVLPLLNGVGHLETLRDVFGEAAVLGGFCNIIVTLNEQGHVVHTSANHDYTFGALVPEQEDFCARLYEAVQGAKLGVHHSAQVYRDMWQKYMFIAAFSGVTTASRQSIDQVLACAPTRAVLRQVLTEMNRLARRKGADLPEELVEMMIAGMEKLPAGSTSSMHQDFRKGLPLEVESLQGAAVRYAEQEGLDVPTIRTVYGLLKPHEVPAE